MQLAQYGALLGLLGCAVANPVRPGSVVVRSPENEARGLLTSLLGGESSYESTSETSYSESHHSESSSSSSSSSEESSGGLLSSVTSSSSESHSSSSSSSHSCSYDISRSWENTILYAGVAAQKTAETDAIQLGLALTEGAFAGSIDLAVEADFLLNPIVKVDLGGVQTYLKVALDATAGVSESVELMSDLSLELAVPGLAEIGIDAGFALDLIFSVSAAIDIESTFNVFFPEGSFIEVNIFNKEIVKQEITGLVVESVPLSIGAEIDLSEDIQLDLVLRLRTGLAISSELDIVGLELGAGAEVAIWLDIFKYTTTYRQGSSGSECSAAEVFALTAGVAVELDVEVGELELGLAPSVIITLASSTATTSTVTIGEGSQSQWGWRQSANSGNGNGIQSGAAGNGTQIGGSGSGSSGSGSGSGSDASSPEGSSPKSGSDNSSPQAGNNGQGAGSGSPTTTVSLTGSGAQGMTTSTVTSTNTYTITSCAASVTNCPNSYTQQIVTSVVVSYTTVCPVTATQTGGNSVTAITGGPSPSSPAGESAGSVTSVVATTPAGPVTVPTPQSPVSLTPYATPSTSTETIPETVPTPAPTVIVTEATTVCPVTATAGVGGHKPSGTGVFVTATGVKSTVTAPVWPSGVAQPSGGWNRPSNGTIPRPSGPAGNNPTPAVTGGNGATPSASGSQPSVTAVQASGAGKVSFGVLAAIAPLFFALM
ncbi:hypothetical protein KVR01_003735 [Diaporthe batatas]|uniref:uncharacterized protein n=1 Tax=Diaporthe batatas TaxID=748121 RepID=UPI001D0539CF|nr:uncharacterized protein KVR01_003735 [Diaporthe batatas]KAG8168046.1 hypothetical protein KVR01_003735 [Diaporthe batatas]